jgi:cytochrome P450
MVMLAARPPDAAAGPRGYPLLGVFARARRDPLGFFQECARRHGDVVAMRFGTRRVYLVSHPDDVRHVLQDNARAYGKSAPAGRIRPLFGDSLTTLDGERWQRQRRLIRPLFQPKRLAFLIPIVVEHTTPMLERWRYGAAHGEPVDALEEMTDLTRAILLRAVFGAVAMTDARRVGQALDVALEHADRRLWSPLSWLDIPTPAERRFRRALRTVDSFVHSMREAGPRGSPDTLLSMLRDAHDFETQARMTDAELHDELKAFLVAGHTTTTSALAWLWHALSAHPVIHATLQRELKRTLGGRDPGADDLPALAYTRMVIDEVLRLYPPTWLTARTPLEPGEVRGHRLPVGSIVLLSPFVTQRHPAFWDDPDRFDPERFTPERSAGRPRFAYFPFGGGPRSCIGSWFATVTMQVVTAILAQHFALSPVPGCRVHCRPGLTLRPGPAVRIELRTIGR